MLLILPDEPAIFEGEGLQGWGSFDRGAGHGFYTMSEARAIVSHRIADRGFLGKRSVSTYWLAIQFLLDSREGSWVVHLTLWKSDR